MPKINGHISLIVLAILLFPSVSWAEKIKTRYAIFFFQNHDQLEEFNDNLRVGKQLYYLVKKRKARTVADEVKNKIDVIVEKVQTILEFYPDELKFRIHLYEKVKDVKKSYQKIYGRKGPYVAFYSPRNNSVYISVEDAGLKVFAHELAHVVIENYYTVPTPPKIHEFLARMATSQITR